MYNYRFYQKEKEIESVKREIEMLEKKKEYLKMLEEEYFRICYDPVYSDDKDYPLLTYLPDNPTKRKHPLYDYSILNVDSVGDIICSLLKQSDGIEVVSQRLEKNNKPILVIGKPDEIHQLDKNKENIIIPFDENATGSKYPCSKPVLWGKDQRSNYRHLIKYRDGLVFEYPNDKLYIKQLIYTLAYYQKKHHITRMSPNETQKVYFKTYY